MLTRRQLLASGAAPLFAQQRRPNIVFILADDLGYADLGCTGDATISTPNIDSIAADGIRLTDFAVAWPACTPSRGAFLTGRYPQRNGLYDMIRNNEVNWKFQFDKWTYATSAEMTLGLDLREVTVGQVMKSAGYATGVIGKWDSGRAKRFLPLQRGFDFFYGFANTGVDYYTHERYGVPSMFRGNKEIKESGHATDLFLREALGFIEANKDRPFFLYVPFNAPHGASTFDKQAVQSPDEHLKRNEGRPRAAYRALVTHLDEAVGGILRKLRDLGLEDNTLVVFSSDNGGTGRQNGPLRGGKASLWEGGYRVPFLARFPGRIPKGQVSHQFATTLELLPTFARLGGAKLPNAKLDGFDLMPLLSGQSQRGREEMFWEQRDNKAARSAQWKWSEIDGEEHLFDLKADPGESRDLVKTQPEALAKMRSKWQAWRKEMDGSEPRGPFRDY